MDFRESSFGRDDRPGRPRRWVGAEFAEGVELELASILPPSGHASRVSLPKFIENPNSNLDSLARTLKVRQAAGCENEIYDGHDTARQWHPTGNLRKMDISGRGS
jgi:hypothetical protein